MPVRRVFGKPALTPPRSPHSGFETLSHRSPALRKLMRSTKHAPALFEIVGGLITRANLTSAPVSDHRAGVLPPIDSPATLPSNSAPILMTFIYRDRFLPLCL
jgi:hypothetical protein